MTDALAIFTPKKKDEVLFMKRRNPDTSFSSIEEIINEAEDQVSKYATSKKFEQKNYEFLVRLFIIIFIIFTIYPIVVSYNVY